MQCGEVCRMLRDWLYGTMGPPASETVSGESYAPQPQGQMRLLLRLPSHVGLGHRLIFVVCFFKIYFYFY